MDGMRHMKTTKNLYINANVDFHSLRKYSLKWNIQKVPGSVPIVTANRKFLQVST